MLVDQDPILRQVKKLAEALARLAGTSSAGPEEIDPDELESLHRELFGVDSRPTRVLAPASMAPMVAPHRTAAAAALLRIEAKLAEARGDAAAARLREAQAAALDHA